MFIIHNYYCEWELFALPLVVSTFLLIGIFMSNDLHKISIEVIKNKIRHGTEPNNPTLISLWLTKEGILQQTLVDKSELRLLFENQFRLLLETIVDDLVPNFWRKTCLDYIYRPLTSLQGISDSEQSASHLRQLTYELSTKCRYIEQNII